MSENNEIKEPLNKNNKVPKLRFKEFSNNWLNCKLSDIAEPIKRKSDGGNWPLMMISASQGFINQSDRYDKDNAGTSKSKYTLIKYGELSYNHGNSKIKKYGAVFAMNNKGALIPFVYHTFSIRKPNNPFYFAKYLNLNMHNRYLKKVISSGARMDGLLNISLDDFFKMPINYPSLEEQNKINVFLEKIDTKINLINDKISILKKYKEGLIKKLIKSSSKVMKLSQLITVCEKTKLQSSYGKISGKYKFFINSSDEITKWLDDYIFDGEYLILNTGGTAFTNYVNGKFSAMSDCLVLKPNSEYSITIYYWLKAVEKWINEVGFQGTGLKHLDINWLLRQKVKIIEYDNEKLSNFNKELNSLIELNSLVLEKLKLIKNIFLNLMFI